MAVTTKTATVTIRDVALAAGVSKTTVGYVLNNTPHFAVPETTRQRVHDAAARLGYRRNALAVALTRGRIHTVGVVLPLRYVVDGPTREAGQVYAKDTLIAIAEAARRAGLRITLTPYDEEDEEGAIQAVDELTDGRVDGLILVSLRSDFARRIYKSGFPCVSIGSGYAERPIRLDNVSGGGAMAEHLLSLGHRRILWCNGRVEGEPTERETGFLRTLTAAGISADRIMLDSSYPDELRGRLSLPSWQRPTGLAAFNDWYALQAVKVAHRCGLRVPEDLSVVGFDDNVFALACDPPLTTVRNPLRELAGESITVLQALWARASLSLPAPIPAQLVIRASTAPPPLSALTLSNLSDNKEVL